MVAEIGARNVVLFGVLIFLGGFLGFVGAVPSAPNFLNITENGSWSGSATGGEVNISGGILSSLNISVTLQNPHWKAFVGWISGKFALDDSSSSTIYDWSLSSIGGQVYATRNASVVDWGNIGCATSVEIDAEDVALEHSGEDNISTTFSGTNSGTYTVAGVPIAAGNCSAINNYVNNNTQSSTFEEFVLSDSNSIVFAAEIEDAATGYDGVSYDFQMIVPENSNESSFIVTPYYLYVEIVN